MLATEECPEMNVRTGKFSDDVEMTVCSAKPYFHPQPPLYVWRIHASTVRVCSSMCNKCRVNFSRCVYSSVTNSDDSKQYAVDNFVMLRPVRVPGL